MKTLEKTRFMLFAALGMVSFLLVAFANDIVLFFKSNWYYLLVAFVVVCLIGIVVSPFTGRAK